MFHVLRPTTIVTERLILAPLAEDVARACLAGDLSVVTRAEGWPHDDTLDALRMATAPDRRSTVWLVMLGNVVIGECGTVGGVDDAGAIEVGYDLAPEHRGRGYGNEVVRALSGWLMAQPRSNGWSRARSAPTTSRRVARWRTQASSSNARQTG